ncbi:DUF7882 family protein [Leifsonia sp. 21MFCrub1.1]|uniref:DUF7882 family protein n=1 Tax=Leifsonia sp. 21MFCrub1.1 TaxID=1798223 RepID=UPI0008928C66|nr:hypothetical protein SAMN04515680_0639 [Leifsonia sp. 21MFCrub1.1]
MAGVDDRTLAHVKVVILTLLRSGQGVAFTFTHAMNEGYGRETIWISPTTDLRFQFFGSRAPQLNRRWIEDMLRSATSKTGLVVTEEPVDVPQLDRVAG